MTAYVNTGELQYLNLLKDILETGQDRMDRTGVGTRAVFGRQLRFNLQEGFPLLTTKLTRFKSILGEALWFLEGSGDERRLAEITFGTRDLTRNTIWTANADAPYWINKAKYARDLGRVYGVQWRSWRSPVQKEDGTWGIVEVDQVANIVKTLKTNPTDRRMMLTAFNPGEIDQMALPPCHMFAQFFVDTENNRLSCQMYMRSIDTFLGLPFNIASYAFLTHIVAQASGLDVGELIITMGDTHIYSNHHEQVKEQISRIPFAFPKLNINPVVKEVDAFIMEDFELVGYEHHPEIKAPMAV